MTGQRLFHSATVLGGCVIAEHWFLGVGLLVFVACANSGAGGVAASSAQREDAKLHAPESSRAPDSGSYVFLPSALMLRQQPDVEATPAGQIQQHTTAVIVDRQDVGSQTWFQIRSTNEAGVTGWVPDEKVAVIAESQVLTKFAQSCFGHRSPGGGTALFSRSGNWSIFDVPGGFAAVAKGESQIRMERWWPGYALGFVDEETVAYQWFNGQRNSIHFAELPTGRSRQAWAPTTSAPMHAAAFDGGVVVAGDDLLFVVFAPAHSRPTMRIDATIQQTALTEARISLDKRYLHLRLQEGENSSYAVIDLSGASVSIEGETAFPRSKVSRAAGAFSPEDIERLTGHIGFNVSADSQAILLVRSELDSRGREMIIVTETTAENGRRVLASCPCVADYCRGLDAIMWVGDCNRLRISAPGGNVVIDVGPMLPPSLTQLDCLARLRLGTQTE